MKISRQRPGDREVDQECITSSAVGLAEADAFAVNFIRVYLRLALCSLCLCGE
jgi:hypothetical protein